MHTELIDGKRQDRSAIDYGEPWAVSSKHSESLTLKCDAKRIEKCLFLSHSFLTAHLSCSFRFQFSSHSARCSFDWPRREMKNTCNNREREREKDSKDKAKLDEVLVWMLWWGWWHCDHWEDTDTKHIRTTEIDSHRIVNAYDGQYSWLCRVCVCVCVGKCYG